MGSPQKHVGFYLAGRGVKKDKWWAWFRFHLPSESLVTTSDQSIVVEGRQVPSGSFWVLVSLLVWISFSLHWWEECLSSLQSCLLLILSKIAVKCFEKIKEPYKYKVIVYLWLLITIFIIIRFQMHRIELLLLFNFWHIISTLALLFISLFYLIPILHL